LYLVAAGVLGLRFVVMAFTLWRRYSDALSRSVFKYSIVYLSALFASLLADHYLIR
jgi:protoheme IX farnesyltransferase